MVRIAGAVVVVVWIAGVAHTVLIEVFLESVLGLGAVVLVIEDTVPVAVIVAGVAPVVLVQVLLVGVVRELAVVPALALRLRQHVRVVEHDPHVADVVVVVVVVACVAHVVADHRRVLLLGELPVGVQLVFVPDELAVVVDVLDAVVVVVVVAGVAHLPIVRLVVAVVVLLTRVVDPGAVVRVVRHAVVVAVVTGTLGEPDRVSRPVIDAGAREPHEQGEHPHQDDGAFVDLLQKQHDGGFPPGNVP